MSTVEWLVQQQKEVENDEHYSPAVKESGKALLEAMIIMSRANNGFLNIQSLAGFVLGKKHQRKLNEK